MRVIIQEMAHGVDQSELFPNVVKCVVCKSVELKKLVYMYLVRYADQLPDLALLSISTFQKGLKVQLTEHRHIHIAPGSKSVDSSKRAACALFHPCARHCANHAHLSQAGLVHTSCPYFLTNLVGRNGHVPVRPKNRSTLHRQALCVSAHIDSIFIIPAVLLPPRKRV